MNVYVTGFNPADCNALKREPRVRLFQAFVELVYRLQQPKNTITWRATRVGDSIPPKTDVVLVSVMLPRSLNSPYALGAIWTISEAMKRNIPLVLYMCDWAFSKANAEFKSIAKAGEDYFYKTIGGSLQYHEDTEKVHAAAPQLLDVCEQYNNPDSLLWKRAAVLVPRYTHWGNVDIIQQLLPGPKPVLTFDPTPIFVQYLNTDPQVYTIPPIDDRNKRWILPSLLKNDTWVEKQDLAWPVVRYGPKGIQVLASERHIQREYVKSVGALCPPYHHEGSGWWRSRWIHSTRARSILLSGAKDAKAAGFSQFHVGWQYEGMSNAALNRIAEEQREAINKRLQLDFDVMDQQINYAIQEAGA